MKNKIEREEVEIINKYVNGFVLDLGCGEGRLYPLLSKRGDYCGIDIDSRYVTKAKSNFPSGSFKIMDADSLSFGDTCFDIVFCGFNVVDEIEDKALSEIYRVLKKDGLFIFSYHNILNPTCLRYYLMRYVVTREKKKIKVKFRTLTKIKTKLSNFQFIKKYGGIFDSYPYCIFKKLKTDGEKINV